VSPLALLSRFWGRALAVALLLMTVAAVDIGSVGPAAASKGKGSWRQIQVTLFCSPMHIGRQCGVTVKPLWDDWNQCVDDNYTRGSEHTLGDRRNIQITLGVTTKCFLQESKMHWRIENAGGWNDVELHVGATGTVTAACGGTNTGSFNGCGKTKDMGFTQLLVDVG
jgi:hypothetical protein